MLKYLEKVGIKIEQKIAKYSQLMNTGEEYVFVLLLFYFFIMFYLFFVERKNPTQDTWEVTKTFHASRFWLKIYLLHRLGSFNV